MDNFPDAMRFDPYAQGLASGYSDLATPFLGPNPRPDIKTPYAMKSTAKWNMPEAFIGESAFLRDTTEDWMLTANFTWYTERILPWRKSNDIYFHWEQWEANPHFMEITPHQSMSNVVTQKRTQMAASMIRRGIAAEFEQDFLNTSVGRGRFIAALAQIARSVQETANVEVIKALLACHRHQQLFARKYHIIKDNELDNYWERKVSRFMIAQKEDFGLEQLSVQIDGEMEKYQAKANVWILGREVSDYCDVVPEGKIYYNLGGQEAVNRINGRNIGTVQKASGGTQGNVTNLQPERLIKGTPVFLAKSFVVDNVGQADLLSRTVEVGIFNTVLCKTRDFKKYRSADMNIRVYSNDKDDWAEILYDSVIANCIMWDENDDDDVMDPFTGNSRRRQVGDTDSENKMDFLRFGTGAEGDAKQDVKYIGDLDMKWLTTKQTLNAAQTMLNTIKSQRKDNTPLDLKGLTLAKDTGVGAVTVNGDVTAFVQAAGNILGSDSLFFKNPADPQSDKDYELKNDGVTQITQNLVKLFLHNSVAKADRYGAFQINTRIESDVASFDKAEAERKHQLWLNTIGQVLPEDKRNAALQKIVTNSEASWKQRALEIQALAMEYKKSDPPSMAMTADRIKSWVEARITQYNSEFNQWIDEQASSGASKSGGNQVKYFPVGTPLPTGYAYLNAQEEAKAKSSVEVEGEVRFRCPTSLSEFAHISEVFESSSGGGGRQMGIAGRRGASLVGARGESGIAEYNPGRGNNNGYEDVDAQGKGIVGGAGSNRSNRLKRRFHNINERIRDIAKSSASIELKWLAILYLGARFNKRRFQFLADQDVLLPCQFLLMRPHCTYRTRYGIKVADGGDAGWMMYGHSSMNVANSATVKTRLLHYTAYMAAVVTQPKNVYVVEDLFCENYFGGMGTSFWSVKEYKNKGANRVKKSIICTMLPLNMPDELETKIDVRGFWYSAAAARLVDAERFSRSCYPGGVRTAMILDWWDPIRKGALGNQVARSRNVDINFVCFQGVQFRFNSTTDSWGDVTIEQGHFGPHVTPGCGKVRKGAFKYLRPANYLSEAQSRH